MKIVISPAKLLNFFSISKRKYINRPDHETQKRQFSFG